MKAIPHKLLLASAMLAFAAMPAFAETATVNVPFTFVANGMHCPAGVYTVSRDPQFNVVRLQSADGAKNFQWIAAPGQASPLDTRVILTFDKLDSGYALRTVQYHYETTNRLDKKVPEYVPTRTIMGQ
jgi:hypothetical protein